MEINSQEIFQTIIAIAILIVIRVVMAFLINRFSQRKNKVAKRGKLVLKYLDFFMFIIATFVLIFIWGIDINDLGLIASSIFAVIGVAFFAQWSVLSNLTSGVIIFFTLPYKIGDIIKIHDKDFPILAKIEDIKAFHIRLNTQDGGIHTYPNSLILQKGVTLVEEGVHTQIVEKNAEIPIDEPFSQ